MALGAPVVITPINARPVLHGGQEIPFQFKYSEMLTLRETETCPATGSAIYHVKTTGELQPAMEMM